MAPLLAVTLPLVPDPAPLIDLLDVFIKHATSLRQDLNVIGGVPVLKVEPVRDDCDDVVWAEVTIDGKTTSVCTPVYEQIKDLVADCAGRADWHDTGVRIGWEMTRDDWDKLRAVLIANAHVAYIRTLLDAGKLDR